MALSCTTARALSSISLIVCALSSTSPFDSTRRRLSLRFSAFLAALSARRCARLCSRCNCRLWCALARRSACCKHCQVRHYCHWDGEQHTNSSTTGVLRSFSQAFRLPPLDAAINAISASSRANLASGVSSIIFSSLSWAFASVLTLSASFAASANLAACALLPAEYLLQGRAVTAFFYN